MATKRTPPTTSEQQEYVMMEGFSPNAVRVTTLCVGLVLAYIGFTTTDTKNTVTGLQRDLASVSKQLDKAQLDQEKFMPATTINDKFSDVNHRLDKMETQLSIGERSSSQVSRLTDGDSAPRSHVQIIK